MREETHCCQFMGYSLRLAARDLLCTLSSSTYHSLCYTSCGALDRLKNSSMDPLSGIVLKPHNTMSYIVLHDNCDDNDDNDDNNDADNDDDNTNDDDKDSTMILQL